MRWLALHLPLLSLESFRATLPPAADGTPPRPLALVEQHRVHSVDAAAAERGVRPGLKRATALALAGDLLLVERELRRDAAALLAVAHAALAFTPMVALHDGQTVLLEVQASLRLFGGIAGLRRRLREALAPLQHRIAAASAPTAEGAALLARWRPRLAPEHGGDLVEGLHATDGPALHRLLAGAPVWMVGPGREHWEALQGMGLKTLADLRVLPRSGVARRFGTAVLDQLDRAWGDKPDPRDPLQAPPVFDSRVELFARADRAEQLLAPAAVLLARLVAWAQARRARIGGFALRMLHERQRQVLLPPTGLAIDLAEPALDLAHLQLLLRERLSRLTLPAPTLELELHCSRIVAAAAPNGELFPTRASAEEGLLRLIERLRARLGDAQVRRLVAAADHRPERASVSVPWHTPAGALPPEAQPPQRPDAELSLTRPAWLLPEPLPLAEREALPLLHGKPLVLLAGPERIESGWWDGGLVARDYYVAAQDDGALLWIFRERLPQPPGDPAWQLQGRFG